MRLKFSLISFIILMISMHPDIAFSESSPSKIKTLYNSLDPTSISKHLAFYELYGETKEGQQALKDTYQLVSGEHSIDSRLIVLPASMNQALKALVGLVNKHPSNLSIELTEAELDSISRLASRLPNRHLVGYYATSEEEILNLDPKQIDLARGILLSQLGNDPSALAQIKKYESMIDLMAIQILAKVSLKDSAQKKIRAINNFIFDEIGFRFPPHSTYAKDVDLYTFLPSVIDSRRGVCLGISILYICLAQRLNLDLEIVTPPGHIYVRWHENDQLINIETTARGINLPNEEYLGIDTRSLLQRNVKETIGMAHFNQASVHWEKQEYEKALASYLKAKLYLGEDKLLMGFISLIYILTDKPDQAKPLLEQLIGYIPDYAISEDTIAEDYLKGNVTKEGIQAVFMRIDETRESLIAKKNALQEALKKCPRFREGYFSLAGTWLQLYRSGEALKILKYYHEIDPHQASVEYYLAEIYAERMDYNHAWRHLRLAEKETSQRNHYPKALIALKQKLCKVCPE